MVDEQKYGRHGESEGHNCNLQMSCFVLHQKRARIGVDGGTLRSHGSPRYPSPWMVEQSLSFPTCAALSHPSAMLTPLAYLQGACGYGYIKKNEWPYWSVGALTPSNQFALAGPAHACGYADLLALSDLLLRAYQRLAKLTAGLTQSNSQDLSCLSMHMGAVSGTCIMPSQRQCCHRNLAYIAKQLYT